MALGTLKLAGSQATIPSRVKLKLPASSLPDIQFDLGAFIAQQQTVNGGGNVLIQMPPVHTVFTTVKLNRTPARGCHAKLPGGGQRDYFA